HRPPAPLAIASLKAREAVPLDQGGPRCSGTRPLRTESDASVAGGTVKSRGSPLDASLSPVPMPRELTEQERLRREHLAALRARGVEPYPAEAWPVTHHAQEILDLYEDERHDPEREGTEPMRVRIAGRMLTKRVMGKAAFFHLADESGKIQVYVRRDDLPEGFYNEVFKKLLDPGDFVGIEGEVFRTKLGEVSVRAEGFKLLSKSLKPLPVEKEVVEEETGEKRVYNEVSDVEFRYRQRY